MGKNPEILILHRASQINKYGTAFFALIVGSMSRLVYELSDKPLVGFIFYLTITTLSGIWAGLITDFVFGWELRALKRADQRKQDDENREIVRAFAELHTNGKVVRPDFTQT